MQKLLSRTINLDITAIALTSACLIHCLALPVLISLLPALSVTGEQEWLHKCLVILAVPVTGMAIYKSLKSGLKGLIVALMSIGISLMIFSLFERVHHYEALMTFTGGVFLVAGHVLRWQANHNA